MLETRNERILRIKKEKQLQKVQMMNQSLKRSLIVVGTTACVGLYVSPVDQLLSANFSVVEASTAATQFLRNIIPAAQNVARGKDIYTSVMIAQAALESGWGTSTLSKAPNHNLFGVKGSYNGQSVNMQTLEDSGGQNYYSIHANFRKYPSYQESLEDYADKIVNGISGAPLFYSGAWKSKTNSYQDATAYLTGRYATDTAYASKLNRIIEQFGLTKYDTETAVNMAEEIASKKENNTSGNTYTVVSGDGLYAISRKTGTPIQELLSLNGLSLNSIIYPGQVLKVTSNSNSSRVVESTPTTVKSSSEQTTGGSYTVVSGDGLYAISRKTGTSIQELLSLNGLSLNSTIYPGQVLKVTSNSNSSPAVESAPTTVKSSSEQTTGGSYTVVSGDGLYAISRKTGTPIQELLSLNGLNLNSVIHPGQVLQLSNSYNSSSTKETVTNTEDTSSSGGTKISGNVQMYYVHKGDTLYRIARNNGISLSTLLEWNQISVDSPIHPGQGLIVSYGSSSSSVDSNNETKSSKSTYTVKAGDGLWRIAKNHGLTLDELKSLNQLTSNIIHPGQVLIVSK